MRNLRLAANLTAGLEDVRGVAGDETHPVPESGTRDGPHQVIRRGSRTGIMEARGRREIVIARRAGSGTKRSITI
jgi:hypothetical protein